VDIATTDPIQPRSRPRHRRDDIAKNAAELFSERGFHAVRMEDIAKASGVTARALYRHYDSKQALLSHVVLQDQQRVIETLTELAAQPAHARRLDTSLTALTNAALETRRLSLLWQREARHLDAADFDRVRRQTRWMANQFRELLISPERDDLSDAVADIRSWVVVSIVSGPGLYDSALPQRRLAQELVGAGLQVIRGPAAAQPDEAVTGEHRRSPTSRRDQLIYAAAGEFRRNGFAGVSIDDIGDQIGVVGPALYRYFDNKADILVASVNRLHEWLTLEMTRALRSAPSDETVINELVAGYVRIALEATDLLAVSLTERLFLPVIAREHCDRMETEHLAEWQRWLSVARPELAPSQAATLVKTAKTIVDDCVRIPHLRQYKIFATELCGDALRALGVPG